MTGLKRQNINRAIKRLEALNIIIVDRNNYINTYKFNANYDTWKVDNSIKIDTKVVSKSIPETSIKIDTHKRNYKRNHLKESKGFFNKVNTGEEEILLQRTLEWFKHWEWKIPADIRERLVKGYIEKYGIDYYRELFNREANKNEPNAIEFLTKILPGKSD